MIKSISLGLGILCLLLTACSHQRALQEDLARHQAAYLNVKLAMIYMLQRQDFPRAKQKLLLAQKQAPKDPLGWYSMGYFQEYTGNNAAAEDCYLRALHLAPHDGAANNNYGAFLCRQRRYQQGIQHFLLALKDPNYLHVADAYENATKCESLLLKSPYPPLNPLTRLRHPLPQAGEGILGLERDN